MTKKNPDSLGAVFARRLMPSRWTEEATQACARGTSFRVLSGRQFLDAIAAQPVADDTLSVIPYPADPSTEAR